MDFLAEVNLSAKVDFLAKVNFSAKVDFLVKVDFLAKVEFLLTEYSIEVGPDFPFFIKNGRFFKKSNVKQTNYYNLLY